MVHRMPTDPTDFDGTFEEHVPSGGVYANDASAWHTRHEFTVDFLARIWRLGAVFGGCRACDLRFCVLRGCLVTEM